MKLHFALVGNKNCGKSTLFNYLTGSNQHVGNFPGVTVQKKEGALRTNSEITVISWDTRMMVECCARSATMW